ncbi:CRISPR-associated endonuclease Cas1 [Tropicimonas sp. IMCC34011]|uniref:CRISPR-associated endonuclease Cas1 n=1 Tax=Tropicimonas sp. IMCC34011 TaxID=2248759 RepID=UPI0013009C8A|nr:CRISPR-associated endonuclease Cas1 [Tropicimonas sp. IMCC34011]
MTSEGARVCKDGETVAVDIDRATRARALAHLPGQTVCYGQTAMPPDLVVLAAEAGTSVAFLSYSGKPQARVEGPQSGNVYLRRARRHLRDYPGTPVAEVGERDIPSPVQMPQTKRYPAPKNRWDRETSNASR